jgi:NTP pyrophosphatase (non-canonical NTP hydrolase)
MMTLLEDTIEEWGESAQMDMAIEEMAELTKAICKFKRNIHLTSVSDIVEEIVDVEIMTTTLMHILERYDPKVWELFAHFHKIKLEYIESLLEAQRNASDSPVIAGKK